VVVIEASCDGNVFKVNVPAGDAGLTQF